MPFPAEIVALVENFSTHEDDYPSAEFKEAQLCQQSLDPLLPPSVVYHRVNFSSASGEKFQNITKPGQTLFSNASNLCGIQKVK